MCSGGSPKVPEPIAPAPPPPAPEQVAQSIAPEEGARKRKNQRNQLRIDRNTTPTASEGGRGLNIPRE